MSARQIHVQVVDNGYVVNSFHADNVQRLRVFKSTEYEELLNYISGALGGCSIKLIRE